MKLYSGEVVAATSSKGNQEKWFDSAQNRWYKLDSTGFEALVETVVSGLLTQSNISNSLGFEVVPYQMEKVIAHKKERVACISPNFLKADEEFITLAHLLRKELGGHYQTAFKPRSRIEQRMQVLVDTVEKVTGLTRFGEYLTVLFEVDALILNEDRHLNNIGVICEHEQYHYCPLFDNGAGFLLDQMLFPFDVETKSLMKQLTAKPFRCTFATQVTVARQLYGSQLRLCIDFAALQENIRQALEFYPKMYHPYIQDRISTIVMLQSKKLFSDL